MSTVQVDLRSTPRAEQGLLLRVVSAVCARGAVVTSMHFSLDATGAGHLTAVVRPGNANAHTLRETLSRIVGVLDVEVGATRPSGRS